MNESAGIPFKTSLFEQLLQLFIQLIPFEDTEEDLSFRRFFYGKEGRLLGVRTLGLLLLFPHHTALDTIHVRVSHRLRNQKPGCQSDQPYTDYCEYESCHRSTLK